ncbi:MAG: hypothetical protein H0U42_05560 [Thermoleophilaceae bacterium]|nr:hypothetical protein [Thermoleophilaceae bacterium]
MAEPVPIACTLSSAGMSERLAEMKLVGASGLLSASHDGAAASLQFRAEPGLSDRLEMIVAAEAECCAFLELELTERDGSLELSVHGPPEAAEIVGAMVGAFSGGPVAP